MMDQTDLFDMEELRCQHAILKDKLKEQIILNDEMLQKVMAKDVKKLHRRTLGTGYVAIFVGLWASHYFYNTLHTSMAFAIYILIIMLAMAAIDFYHARLLPGKGDLSGDLASIDQRFIKFVWWKKLRITVGMSLMMPFFIWLFFEIPAGETREALAPWLIGGAIVGLLLGFLKLVQTRQDIRKVRSDLTKLERLKKNE